MAHQTDDIVDVFVTATGAFIRDGKVLSTTENAAVVEPTSGSNVTVPLSDIVRNYSEQFRDQVAIVKSMLLSMLYGGSTWNDCVAFITRNYRGVVTEADINALKSTLNSDISTKVSALNAIKTAQLS